MLYAKKIEGTVGRYRLHTDGCQAVRHKGTPVIPNRREAVLVMQGDYPMPVHLSAIGKPCRSCKAKWPTELLVASEHKGEDAQ